MSTYRIHFNVIIVKCSVTPKTSVVDMLHAAVLLKPDHCTFGQRDKPAKCVNCSGDHPANSKQCQQ